VTGRRWERRVYLLGAFGVLCLAVAVARTHVLTVDWQYQNAPVTGILIDINAAGADELALLHQIGPERAQRIVAHRDANGPFRSYPELMRVEGIGPKTLESLMGQITLGAPATADAAIAPAVSR
jgi:competence ComEA-like helix-hairpin-helix protein